MDIEQEEIAKNKASGKLLTWNDLANMKYTWRVALETLRIYPPVYGAFKKVLKDFEYEGYTIPKGWQVWKILSLNSLLFPKVFVTSYYKFMTNILFSFILEI